MFVVPLFYFLAVPARCSMLLPPFPLEVCLARTLSGFKINKIWQACATVLHGAHFRRLEGTQKQFSRVRNYCGPHPPLGSEQSVRSSVWRG